MFDYLPLAGYLLLAAGYAQEFIHHCPRCRCLSDLRQLLSWPVLRPLTGAACITLGYLANCLTKLTP